MSSPLNLTTLTLFAFMITCCVVDVRTRRIPNVVSGSAAIIGCALSVLAYGPVGALYSLSGVVVMIALLITPFALGGLGGGDVKMMAAVGAFLGPRLAVLGLAAGMVLGGIVMTIHLVRVGRLAEKLGSLKAMIVSAGITRSAAPLRVTADDPSAISLPYSIPLGLGTAAVVVTTALIS